MCTFIEISHELIFIQLGAPGRARCDSGEEADGGGGSNGNAVLPPSEVTVLGR